MFLEKIVANTKKELIERKKEVSLKKLKKGLRAEDEIRDFRGALNRKEIALIAEIKKASPSKGLIREDFLPKEIAQRYTQNGVSVISVLTDARFFLGSLEYLRQVREVTDLPLLRKDFIIDPYQLYESQAAGADAVLLIVNILTEEELRQMLNLTKELGLTALVEIHTLAELEIAKRVDAKVIGINNRNLKTFDTNIEQTLKLKDFLPKDKILVSESGISTRIDVEQLASAGVDGILVGEALMKSDNLGRKVQTLLGKDVATNG